MQIATDIAHAGASPSSRCAHRATDRRLDFEVEVDPDAAGLDALAPDWLALEALSPQRGVPELPTDAASGRAISFLEAKARPACTSPSCARGGRAVLILPLVISGLPPFRVARIAGDPMAQYSEILVDPALRRPAHSKRARRPGKLAPTRSCSVGCATISQLLRLGTSIISRRPTADSAAPLRRPLRASPITRRS